MNRRTFMAAIAAAIISPTVLRASTKLENNIYPIDFDSYKPGDIIPRSKIEQLAVAEYGEEGRYGRKRFDLMSLTLRGGLHKTLQDRYPWLRIESHGGDLHILEAEEAAPRNFAAGKKHVSRAMRDFARHAATPMSQLSDEGQKRFQREAVLAGALVAGIASGRTEYRKLAQTHERITPRLDGP